MDTRRTALCAFIGIAVTATAIWQGCGGEGLVPTPADLSTDEPDPWSSSGVSTNVQEPGTTLVEEPIEDARLSVSPLTAQLDTTDRVQSIRVQAAGGEAISYRMTPNVIWLDVAPYEGLAGQAEVRHKIEVLSSSLPPGDHNAVVTVSTLEGVAARIVVTFSQNGPPTLAVLDEAIDFGGKSNVRTLDVANAGPGSLGFTVSDDADWLEVTPDSGTLSEEPLELSLRVARRPLYVGAYTATVTVVGDNGDTFDVPVAMEKPLTSPKILPWTPYQWTNAVHENNLFAAAHHWSRVTDTLVLDAVWTKPYVDELRAQYPNLKLIFGIMSTAHLGRNSFDSVAGWQSMAAAIESAAQTGDERRVLLDHEYALDSYLDGDVEIDLDQFRYCLTFVPDDVDILWYPGIQWGSTIEDGERIHPKTLAIATIANEEIDGLELVDLSYGGAGFSDNPRVIAVRDEQDALMDNPTVPLAWFGCTYVNCWWEEHELNDAMADMQGRSEALVYHLGVIHDWPRVSEFFADNLSEEWYAD